MPGFLIRTPKGEMIHFQFYHEAAPITIAEFSKTLPFSQSFLHARVSGQEIWTDKAPELDIIQENASVFAAVGEIGIGPRKPGRVKTAGCMGIYYGEGKGVDACNIFGKVIDEDLPLLQQLGNRIWMKGEEVLTFEIMV